MDICISKVLVRYNSYNYKQIFQYVAIVQLGTFAGYEVPDILLTRHLKVILGFSASVS